MDIKKEIEKIAYEPNSNHWVTLVKESKTGKVDDCLLFELQEQFERNVNSEDDKIVSVSDLEGLLHRIYETKERNEYELEVKNDFVAIKTKKDVFVFRQQMKKGDMQDSVQTKMSSLFTLSSTNPFKKYPRNQGPYNPFLISELTKKTTCTMSDLFNFYLMYFGKETNTELEKLVELHKGLDKLDGSLTVPFCLSSAISSSYQAEIRKVEIRERFILVVLDSGIAFQYFDEEHIDVKMNSRFEGRLEKKLKQELTDYAISKWLHKK